MDDLAYSRVLQIASKYTECRHFWTRKLVVYGRFPKLISDSLAGISQKNLIQLFCTQDLFASHREQKQQKSRERLFLWGTFVYTHNAFRIQNTVHILLFFDWQTFTIGTNRINWVFCEAIHNVIIRFIFCCSLFKSLNSKVCMQLTRTYN